MSHHSEPAELANLMQRLATIRHDLRTPVNAIIGYSELLLDELTSEPSPLRTYMETLRKNGQQLLQLINHQLDEKQWSGATSLQLIDIDSLVGQLNVEVEPLVHNTLDCLQYCHLLVPSIVTLDNQAWDSDLNRIGAAAQQLREMTSRRMVASISIDSLELIDSTTQNLGTPSHPQTEPSLKAKEKKSDRDRILVVDDVETNRDLLARYLRQQRYQVVLASNGRKALEMMDEYDIDLVLLDVIIPELDGYGVLQALKANPAWRDIPVIMISALDKLDTLVRCIEAGAEDYLPKPFNPVLLRARLRSCLEQKHLRDQELDYLQQVAYVTEAAGALEAGSFNPETLASVMGRQDSLGQLARVFERMAAQVQLRQLRLQEEVKQLRIEIDHSKRSRQVAEITGSDYFQNLKQKIKQIRQDPPARP